MADIADSPLERFLYFTAQPPGHERLARAEAEAVTGGRWVSHRCIASDAEVDVGATAFLHWRLEPLATAGDFDDLRDAVAALGLTCEDMRIDVVKRPRRWPLEGREAIVRLAAVIKGGADLSDPRHRLGLVMDDGWFAFGRLLQETDNNWRERVQKPFTLSAALGPRVSLATVNLIARPGERLIDPCCGSGSIALEAARIGLRAFAFDVNPTMVWGARRNARHYGLELRFGVGDIRTLSGRFDVVATNLPYGVALPVADDFYREVAQNLSRIAPRVALIVGRDLRPLLEAAGHDVTDVVIQGETDGKLARHIHLVRCAG